MQAENLRIWLKKPLVIAVLSGLLLLTGVTAALQGLLDWQVQRSILRNAEIKAENWSTDFFRLVPDAEGMFVAGTDVPPDVVRMESSFAMVDILRFELFDPEGTRTYLSGSDAVELNEASSETAVEVYRTGKPAFYSAHDDEAEEKGNSHTYIEVYLPAVTPSGQRLGTMEIYVDVSSLEVALEDAFAEISWLLVIGTTLILAIPAAAYVRRTRQLRNQDQRLLELTRYDQLTGVLNRNSISDVLDEAFSAPDQSDGLGVLFVDVDYFKQVNDRFGHACGDRLLRHIADLLKSSIRGEEDIVGRFGGDEFVVLCRDIGQAKFRALCARVMEGARAPCEYEGRSYTPSLSAGAYLTRPGDTQKSALHRADLAVYAAKRGGRGQVVEYSDKLETLFEQETAKRAPELFQGQSFSAAARNRLP